MITSKAKASGFKLSIKRMGNGQSIDPARGAKTMEGCTAMSHQNDLQYIPCRRGVKARALTAAHKYGQPPGLRILLSRSWKNRLKFNRMDGYGTQDKHDAQKPRLIVKRQPHSLKWISSYIIVATGLLSLVYINIGSKETSRIIRSSARKDYQWSDISPSKDLRWFKCYEGRFECARLDVPLNWLDPSESQRVYLGVIRAQAKDHADYRGPVFVNPGVRASWR